MDKQRAQNPRLPAWTTIAHPPAAYAAAAYTDRGVVTCARSFSDPCPTLTNHRNATRVRDLLAQQQATQTQRYNHAILLYPDTGALYALIITIAGIMAIAVLTTTILIDQPQVRNDLFQLIAVPGSAAVAALIAWNISLIARRRQLQSITRFITEAAKTQPRHTP